MLSANAVVRPRCTPMNDSSRAKECASGRKSRWVSPSWIPDILAADPSVPRWLPWVWTTPLGGPVVPDVYTMVAMSSGPTAATRLASSPRSRSRLSRPRRRSPSQVMTRAEDSPWWPCITTICSSPSILPCTSRTLASCAGSSTNRVFTPASLTMYWMRSGG